MSDSRSGSLINFVWFLLFLGCVGGLIVWGVDAASSPGTAKGTPAAQAEPRPREPAPNRFAQDVEPVVSPSRGQAPRNEVAPRSELPPRREPAPQPTVVGPASYNKPRASISAAGDVPAVTQRPDPARPAATANKMVRLPGGSFRMGYDKSGFQSERPAHDVVLRPFWLDPHEVTVAEFAEFVRSTGHKTTAELQGWAPVFNPKTDNWDALAEAHWRRPRGPEGRKPDDTDPVTQVSWEDAAKYARWAGKRLPTEAEWEYAARGGLTGCAFPWGNELTPGGEYRANYWQGEFPTRNTGADGFRGPAYVGSYPPNGFGLYDMSGNVWEWCSDWFSQSYYRKSPLEDPQGPETGTERAQRGGSWFCSPDAMPGYMVYSRMSAPPKAMYPHLGFRCARDAE